MSFQREYERDVINAVVALFPRPGMPRPIPRMSSEDEANEWKAQHIVYAAVQEFKTKIESAIPLTSTRADELRDMLAAVSDTLPNKLAWEEGISAGIK